jgi:hypothetical protein
MADNPRRRFLKTSAGVVSGLAIGAGAQEPETEATSAGAIDRDTLDALARIVLPRRALGDSGITHAVDGFLAWLEGFDPVSERDHPYDSAEIHYGPPDPAPLWKSQLEALNLEAGKRYAAAFTDLGEARQMQVLRNQLPEHIPETMPYAGDATHVAIGLLAWFYATPEANDLALQAKIGKYTCRGLASGADEPEPLGS